MILILETNFDRFNSCLLATEVFSLTFTCRFIRKKYLPKLKILFDLADGFGSQQRWNKFLGRTFTNLFSRILYTDIIEDWSLNFLFKKFSKQIRSEIFCHLNLPSILFHFLKCKRFCDAVPHKCMKCSRVGPPVDSLWQPYLEYFDDISVEKDNCSFFQQNMLVDLDVFKSKANEYFRRYSTARYNRHWRCFFYKEIHYSDELFCSFSSHLLRLFINVIYSVMQRFSLISSCQEELVRELIAESAHFFTNFIHQFNTEYFYEFFDKFKDINESACYSVVKKQQFGPYIHSAFDITIDVIRF